MAQKFPVVVLVCMVTILSGCRIEEIQGQRHGNGDNPPVSAQNAAPTIAGAPPASILEGELYDFTPNASDPDGDTLEYSISRKPDWASFNRTTGRLWGTPGAGDVGNFTNIAISVSDGKASTALRDFNITVDAIGLGQATLSWLPPTSNDDGSPLTDLAGYRVYYGRNQYDLTRVAVLDNPSLTRYVIEDLTAAKWFFAMTAVNSKGSESNRTVAMSKTIN